MATIETTTEIVIDRLTEKSVSILTKTYADVNGENIIVNNHRRAYVNSEDGRLELTADLNEPYLSAVMAMWGDEPTVTLEEIAEE